GTKLGNLTFGGSQEYDKRPGTQNTSGIIGFAKAIELLGQLEKRQKNADKISLLRDKLIQQVLKIENVVLNGPVGELRTADNASFTIYDVDQDGLMTAPDIAGIAASTGSACVSGSSKPSHVIESLRLASDRQAGVVRFTLSMYTKFAEINYVIKTLAVIIKKLRA
ncbi:MAG: aminotransferase class V-fold PLP-dependent enzyme, partial [Candidatus Doudnabacteria bacterium]|nr:aminotransferase class V-fold PLP-dependent enzyme [Candidatus Doudnabacteria bacterium]